MNVVLLYFFFRIIELQVQNNCNIAYPNVIQKINKIFHLKKKHF